MEKPDAVVCYWKYNADEKFRKWEFVEAYPIDQDGHPLKEVKNTGKINSREEWNNWLYKLSDNGDFDPIMCRAATIWTWSSGVGLLGYNPPQWCSWLSITFHDHLRESKNWLQILEGAHELYFGTINEARKIVESKS